ncbi:SymE family type I addiction module toxin [Microbulbifer sp. 2304DJ12-6]|uniref:SymE family type I addiction module toxin n=1 Tax=Microbulbifer sp. 2304DJ12-6 TaxID=3233340 RepID=UPI0039B0C713
MATGNGKTGVRLRKSKPCEERHIKVSETYYEYRLKAQSPYSGNRSVPWIQMKGHWLRQAGFEINTPVKVRVMAGCLVLTVE